MITADIRFLSNNAVVELSDAAADIQKKLQSIGVLTSLNLIMLDNARTLKIELTADDTTGENILKLINCEHDTLGDVNRLCNHVCRMDYRDDMVFSENLEKGEYRSLTEALKAAEKLKEQRRIKNKRHDMRR